MSNLKSKSMGWGRRFAIIGEFGLDDTQAQQVFGLEDGELGVARKLMDKGHIRIEQGVDFSQYEPELGNLRSSAAPTTATASATKPAKTVPAKKSVTKKSVTTNKPVTATKPKKPKQKRGRKGDKIVRAFNSVPKKPTNAEDFAQKHQVSMAVLRQAKRFDKSGKAGRVMVKKNRQTGELQIWRAES